MKIRLACTEELESIHGIVKAATRHMDEQGISQWDEVYPSRGMLSEDIERKELHVIEIEGRVAGCVVINEEQSPEYGGIGWAYPGRALVVHRLTVHPAHQRKGLATRLIDFAEKTAVAKGYDCIRLDAFTRNPTAFMLYEKRGYRKAGTVCFRKGEFFCYEKTMRA